MNFDLSEEQLLLRTSLSRFVGDTYQSKLRRAQRTESLDAKRQRWRKLADLGVLSLAFAENDGGLGGGAVDIGVVAEVFGTGLVCEPFYSTVLLAGGLVAAEGSDQQKHNVLAPVMGGEHWLALAWAERDARFDLAHVHTTARRQGSDFILEGTKTLVLDGGLADAFVVVARTSGATTSSQGLSAFLVPAGVAGLMRRGYVLADGSRPCELQLSSVRVPAAHLVGRENEFHLPLETAVTRTCVALCSEAVGLASAVFEITLEHLRTRKQFGTTLGSFQAIQHRMAEACLSLEQARSITLKAMLADPADRAAWLRIANGAKALVSRAALHIAEEAVQFHGAMGITEDLAVGEYLKRVHVIATLFGNPPAHLDRVNALATEGAA